MGSQRKAVTRALAQWQSDGRAAVLATVVSSSDSAPRGLGAQLAITDGPLWVGGLSGGCAEAEVLAQAADLLSRGREAGTHAVLITMTRDELGSAGPVCGATLEVLVERADESVVEHLRQLDAALQQGQAVRAVRSYVREQGELRRTGMSREQCDPLPRDAVQWDGAGEEGELQLRELLAPPIRLVVGGAGDVASELIQLARQLGWRSALVDPRSSFVEQTVRAAAPDDVVAEWPAAALEQVAPDAFSACVAAAHDEKLDLPFLAAALGSEAFYVGSIGSRVVQHARREQLMNAVGADTAGRHRGPAGLNLGGSDASEIALSIASEIIAVWNGRTGAPLQTTSEPIRAR